MLIYRSDIDGLRAVAVLTVLGFHTGVARMSGGFVGVDIFFVISGYLISSIVFGEIAASRFSVIAFYERRIRRIFPALSCMLFIFAFLGTIYFLPPDLINFSKSLLAATMSASNFYFWRQSGYFFLPTTNPLLHTWSLAVEEQFYILFPLFLVLVRRFFPRRLKAAVVGLFIVSLVASAAIVPYSKETAFYMPYTRAWELLLGTLISLGMFPRLHSRWLRNFATLAGTAAIAYSVFRYDQSTSFPGLYALTPCIGSALIIGAGESGPSLVSYVLSWRPVVFVGLISYSLYLWHWPVIVLHDMGALFKAGLVVPHKYVQLISERHLDAAIEILLSFVLATLSWRFVERPFRNGSLRMSGRQLFAFAGAVTVVFIGFASWVISAEGFPGRFSLDSDRMASLYSERDIYVSLRGGTCFITMSDRFEDFNRDLCLQRRDGENNYLLLGDSHSAALWRALSSSHLSANFMQASAGPCGPYVHPHGMLSCKKMMTYIFQNYLPSHPVQGLFLESRWWSADINDLAETIAWAKQHRIPVVLFGPVQEYDAPLPRLLAYSIAWNLPELPAQHRVSENALLDSQLASLAANTWHVPYVSLYKAICNDGECTEYADAGHTVPLMFDADHLSQAGSQLIVRRLIERGELH
jgi:peptidoglycan/LPS O-acetylase OafA/YrhL